MGDGGSSAVTQSPSGRTGWKKLLSDIKTCAIRQQRYTKTDPFPHTAGKAGMAALSLDKNLCEAGVPLQANMETLSHDIKYSLLTLY